MLSSHLVWVFQVGSFPQISPHKPCIHLYSPPYVLRASPIGIVLHFINILSLLGIEPIIICCQSHGVVTATTTLSFVEAEALSTDEVLIDGKIN